MSTQSFDNHRKFVRGYHVILTAIVVLTIIGSIYHLTQEWNTDTQYAAALLIATNLGVFITAAYARLFALKAQDRAIRAEENMRHYVMTGKALDSRLTMRQTIGLRFASDSEFEALCQRAIDENMSESDIKAAIQDWRADEHRL